MNEHVKLPDWPQIYAEGDIRVEYNRGEQHVCFWQYGQQMLIKVEHLKGVLEAIIGRYAVFTGLHYEGYCSIPNKKEIFCTLEDAQKYGDHEECADFYTIVDISTWEKVVEGKDTIRSAWRNKDCSKCGYPQYRCKCPCKHCGEIKKRAEFSDFVCWDCFDKGKR